MPTISDDAISINTITTTQSDAITFIEAKKELDIMLNNFRSATTIKIIPILSNGNPSKSRYIYFPFEEEYIEPNSMRGGIFRSLKYAYTNPPYIDFQPKMVTLDEDGSESYAFAQYYSTISNYQNFIWFEMLTRKKALENLYNACLSEINFISGEASNGILVNRFEEIKTEFKEKIQKFAEPWHYKESDWNTKPTLINL